MRRSLNRTLSLQTATIADDGLQNKPTWATTSTVDVPLVPAARADSQLAGMRGERVTHMALVPKGLALQVDKNRFLDGTVVYRIVSVTEAPKHSVCMLEAVT